MKFIVKEWTKSPKACVLIILLLIVRTVSVVVSSEVLLMSIRVIDNLSEWRNHVSMLVVLLIIQASCHIIISYTGYSKDILYERLVCDYCDKLLHVDYKMFTELSCSKIVNASQQIWKIANIGDLSVWVVMNIVTLLTYSVQIYRIIKWMVAPVIFIYVIGLIFMKFLFTWYGKIDTEVDDIKRERNQEIDEIINGFVEVRAFNTQVEHAASIRMRGDTIFHSRRKRLHANAAINILYDAIDAATMLFVIWYSVITISNGEMSPAIAAALLSFAWKMLNPMMGLLNNIDNLSMLMSQIDEYKMVVEYKNEYSGPSNVDLTTFDTSIDFRNVSFAYNDSSAVLNGLDLIIPKGKHIGICGPSGGGKSTIMKLLMKYYTIDDGAITIDNMDLRDISAHSLRDMIAPVHQDNHIFNASIYDNIAYGNRNATLYDIIEACKKANINEFIQSLPEGFHTQVGPKGLKLSGGQKQRIALARVFLNNPEIILLDEATSALDNQSESVVQEALKMFEGKTVITIAHRLTTIKDCDVIYVVKDHHVTEYGTYKELMEKKGDFYNLKKAK